MLVLTRKLGERVQIGPDISLVVVAVHGTAVRLGFEAPVDVPVLREELLRSPSPPQQHVDVPAK